MSWEGSKYASLKENSNNRAVIAKLIKKDLQTEFGKDWTFRSKKNNHCGIDVFISKAPLKDLIELDKEFNYYKLSDPIKHKMIEIINAYNYDYDGNSNSCFDDQDFEAMSRNYYYSLSLASGDKLSTVGE